MTNEKLTESLQLLREMVVKTNKVMQQAEKTVETAMLMMMKNATDEDTKRVQSYTRQINEIMKKAKDGESVDTDVENMKKNIKSWQS